MQLVGRVAVPLLQVLVQPGERETGAVDCSEVDLGRGARRSLRRQEALALEVVLQQDDFRLRPRVVVEQRAADAVKLISA
jgi:hypothetical protein